ncbi:MAG: OmpA family protein [Flavobacteriaceae bacterium]
MRTIKPLLLLSCFCLFFLGANTYAQNPLKKAKKKLERKAGQVIDKEFKGDEKKIESKEEEQQVYQGKGKSRTIDRNFIRKGDRIFYDDFINERATEFPSKWTQVSGEIQNEQFEEFDQNNKVIEWISNYATIKPSIKGDNYLGDSFKVEIQVHFNLEGGNQFYNINFKNSNMVHGNYDLRIANSLIGPGSDNLARMPGQPPRGWHTIQLSFNKGNLKAFFDGHQLVNNPDIGKYEFTHLEVYASSPGSSREGHTRSMINHFAIGKAGLPLYDRIMTSGRIVVHDIHFDVDKYDIKETSYPALDRVLKMLEEHEDMEVTIEGHTDANGTNEDNLTLSEKRAEAVKNYLVSKGIKRYRLSSKGYGEERPIAMGDNEEAWRQNRRVEFVMPR